MKNALKSSFLFVTIFSSLLNNARHNIISKEITAMTGPAAEITGTDADTVRRLVLKGGGLLCWDHPEYTWEDVPWNRVPTGRTVQRCMLINKEKKGFDSILCVDIEQARKIFKDFENKEDTIKKDW